MAIIEHIRALAIIALLATNAICEPAADQPAVEWLRGSGKDLQLCLKGEVVDDSPQQVADFIHEKAPAREDAEEKWNAAFAEAKRTGRRVWVRISQRYCGPCFLLTRWLDDQHKLLDKDYVFLKIDDVRDKNGPAIAERLTGGKYFGIPFHAIFDDAGKMLITSEGPQGNVGCAEGVEGKKHLHKMLLAPAKISQTPRSINSSIASAINFSVVISLREMNFLSRSERSTLRPSNLSYYGQLGR